MRSHRLIMSAISQEENAKLKDNVSILKTRDVLYFALLFQGKPEFTVRVVESANAVRSARRYI
jgi:hypothetical protein